MKRSPIRALRTPPGRRRRVSLTLDEAFIALLISAVEASGHASPEELARAHEIVWSMRRFRRKSGDTVGRGIARMRALLIERDPAEVIAAAARAIPARRRPAAFALAADLVLVDGRLTRPERRFLDRLAAELRLAPSLAKTLLDVLRIKNSA